MFNTLKRNSLVICAPNVRWEQISAVHDTITLRVPQKQHELLEKLIPKLFETYFLKLPTHDSTDIITRIPINCGQGRLEASEILFAWFEGAESGMISTFSDLPKSDLMMTFISRNTVISTAVVPWQYLMKFNSELQKILNEYIGIAKEEMSLEYQPSTDSSKLDENTFVTDEVK